MAKKTKPANSLACIEGYKSISGTLKSYKTFPPMPCGLPTQKMIERKEYRDCERNSLHYLLEMQTKNGLVNVVLEAGDVANKESWLEFTEGEKYTLCAGTKSNQDELVGDIRTLKHIGSE